MKTTTTSRMIESLTERKATLRDIFAERVGECGTVAEARKLRDEIQARIDRATRAQEYLRDRLAR